MAVKKTTTPKKASKGKAVLKATGRALKGAARGILASGAQILGASATALNPHRRIKIRNAYIDLVIKGQAKKTPQGWKVGKKTFEQGRGTVNVSSGYYLDRRTGMVYAKRERNKTRKRNIEQGFYDEHGFHPIRASSDYSEGQRPSRSKKTKARKAKAKSTATHKRKVASRKKTTKSLAGRSLARTTSTGKRPRKRNIAEGFYDASGVFHPIRSAADYSPAAAGEAGGKAKRTRSRKKVSAKRKASATARHRSVVKTRKAATSRLASRTLKSSGAVKRKRNAGSWKDSRVTWAVGELLKMAEKGDKAGVERFNKKAYADWAKGSNDRKDELERGYQQALKILKSKTANPNATRAIRSRKTAKSSRRVSRAGRKPAATGFKKRMAVARKKKTNPSPDAIRKEFAGRHTKDSRLYFPDGTPQGLAKLGKLVLIKTKSGPIQLVNRKGEVWLCVDTNKRFHLGSTINAPLFDGAKNFGEVKEIEYQESKPHLGYTKKIIWFHHMGEEGGRRPELISNSKGELKFKGGDYRITTRGIEN